MLTIEWMRSISVASPGAVQHVDTWEDYGVSMSDDVEYRELIGDGLAKVNASFKFSLDFAKVTASVSASVTCDQDADTMTMATKLLQQQAIKLTEEGMDMAIETYTRKYGPPK